MEYLGDWYWDNDWGPSSGLIVTFGRTSEKAGCFPCIGIMSVELPKSPKVTLEDYYSHSRIQLTKLMENEKPVREGDTTIDGLPAKTLTHTVRGERFAAIVSWVFLLKENTAYLIVYHVSPECYDDYLDCFELVLDTFQFE